MKKTCEKCGAVNDTKSSKHRSFVASGKKCCGHCGNVMCKQ